MVPCVCARAPPTISLLEYTKTLYFTFSVTPYRQIDPAQTPRSTALFRHAAHAARYGDPPRSTALFRQSLPTDGSSFSRHAAHMPVQSLSMMPRRLRGPAGAPAYGDMTYAVVPIIFIERHLYQTRSFWHRSRF